MVPNLYDGVKKDSEEFGIMTNMVKLWTNFAKFGLMMKFQIGRIVFEFGLFAETQPYMESRLTLSLSTMIS